MFVVGGWRVEGVWEKCVVCDGIDTLSRQYGTVCTVSMYVRTFLMSWS